MKKVEIVYSYAGEDGVPRERPADAAEALCRMNAGSRAFAELFCAPSDGTGQTVQRVISVDPRDVGLLPDGSGSPEQHPFAVVLGCADARVPVELIFNEGPNDLFVVRVAGNTLGEDVRGSINYAIEHLGGSLRLIVVLGHSGCGAVTAAVDVFLHPAGYLSIASNHAVRLVVDRLLVVVHAAARRLESCYGPDIATHPRYREALIDIAVITNAAVGAHTLQRQVGGTSENGVKAVYGAYEIETRMIWAPRCGSDEVVGLAPPPQDEEGFVEFSKAVLRSRRITSMLGTAQFYE